MTIKQAHYSRNQQYTNWKFGFINYYCSDNKVNTKYKFSDSLNLYFENQIQCFPAC